MEELLDVKEVSGKLKIKVSTLRAWIFQKRIPHIRLGRRVLFRPSDLEDFVNKRLVKAAGKEEHRV